MPELPEVQTVVDDLNKKIKGDTIVGFWSGWEKSIKGISAKKFAQAIQGEKILKAWRLGKNMFIDLSNGKTIYIHLKMTGHLLVKERANDEFRISNFEKNKNSDILKLKIDSKLEPQSYFNDKVNQYIHHIWYLNSEKKLKINKLKIDSKFNPPAGGRNSKFYSKTLEFSDLRKFAKIVLVDTDKVRELPEIKKLGLDALDPKFTFKKFNAILDKKSKSPIGIVLMDQDLIAGIGNIYRSEILFVAGIDPRRLSADVNVAEREKIFKAIGKILKKAVLLRGTSDSDYRDTDGAPGGFQKVLSVYNREGDQCGKCGTIVERFKLGQRSVFYCPKCQK